MMTDMSVRRGRLGQNMLLPPDWNKAGYYALVGRETQQPLIVHMLRNITVPLPMDKLPGSWEELSSAEVFANYSEERACLATNRSPKALILKDCFGYNFSQGTPRVGVTAPVVQRMDDASLRPDSGAVGARQDDDVGTSGSSGAVAAAPLAAGGDASDASGLAKQESKQEVKKEQPEKEVKQEFDVPIVVATEVRVSEQAAPGFEELFDPPKEEEAAADPTKDWGSSSIHQYRF